VKTTLLALLMAGMALGAGIESAAGATPAKPDPRFAPLPASSATENNNPAQTAVAANTNSTPADPAQVAKTNSPTPAVVPPPAAQPNAVVAAPPATAGAVLPPASQIPVPAAALPPGVAAPGEQLVAITPPAGATNGPAEEVVPAGTINFPATDLNQVLQIYAELVGRTVLRPTSLPAPTITLKTQTPLTKREAIEAFDAVLALNGITVANVGDKFVKVVPATQGGQIGTPFVQGPLDKFPEMGQFVTHIVQVTNAKPSELVQALTPFASAGIANGILPIDSSQILVLRDYSENVKRMLEMVKKIDVTVPSEYDSEVIPIKYALASDIASALNSLSAGGGGTTVGAAPGGAGVGAGARPGLGGSRYGTGIGSRTGIGGTFPGSTTPGATPFGTTSGGTQAGGTGSSFTQRLQNIINRASVSGEIQVIGQTKIIADERTNSLLIFATKDDMKTIKKIVSQLDIVLAQVLIEAVIIEVSLDDTKNLGVSYLEKQPHPTSGYFRGIGAINNNNILSANNFNPIGQIATNAAVALPGGFSYLASLNNDLDISVTAIAANNRARILQRPRIQTSHAVPAALFVGESRPYPTASYYGGGAFGGYSSIQQLQIGVTLEVTPLINPDGLVVMDIHQKIDSFKGNVTIQNVGDVPITSSKDATAKVAVRDHDTIMLGGLIETQKTSNNSGIPVLKDLPLLGFLFRSSSKDDSRSELIVLIRPTVLPTPEIAALTAKAEKDKMPEVRRMEQEIQSEDAKRLNKANVDLAPKTPAEHN
jgi:general secretion pathway protein D